MIDREEDNILIFDDLISPYLQDFFYASIFGFVNDEKVYPTVAFTTKYETTAMEDDGSVPMSFNHILKSDAKLSEHLENFSLLVQKACKHQNVFLKDIRYGRIFLTMPYQSKLDYAAPHTDLGYPHWVVLYYVNDADGDTVFFDKNKKIIKRVTPKKGRLVFFKGDISHSGGIPKKSPRCVVNFDIII